MSIPENVFMLGNCPHDWLFPRVSCVVHHGGAGTMAAGIAAGKPTVIVPFFGDQPFWGDMVARAGAGPAPIPYKKLTTERLAAALIEALQPAMTERAVELGALINQETGAETAVSSFYSHLPLRRMHCSISPSRLAVWRVSKTNIRLSAMAAAVLAREGVFDLDDLRLYSSDTPQACTVHFRLIYHRYGACDHRTDHGASDPLSATVKVSYRMISDLLTGFSDVSRGMYKSLGPKFEKSPSVSTASSSAGDVSDRDTGSEAGEGVDSQKSHQGGTLAPPEVKSGKRSRTKKGLKRLGAMPFKTTADFTASLAQGLHNAPKLYGDKTVRPPEKITGWQSGLKAAGKVRRTAV
jgi:hypothetical protein